MIYYVLNYNSSVKKLEVTSFKTLHYLLQTDPKIICINYQLKMLISHIYDYCYKKRIYESMNEVIDSIVIYI
jgi:hypothetical protein